MLINEKRLKRIEEKLEKLEKLEKRIDELNEKLPPDIIINYGEYSQYIGAIGREAIGVSEAVEKIMAHLKLEFKVQPEKSKEYKIVKSKKK